MADSSDLHVGRDGWLFLVSGSNNVVGQYVADEFAELRTELWQRLVVWRSTQARVLGARYVHLVVPEKLTVYDDRLDGFQVDVARAPAVRLARGLARAWRRPPVLAHPLREARRRYREVMGRRAHLDLVGPFRAARDGADLYLKRDSHWSFAGRELAYRLFCRACGAVPRADFAARPARWTQHRGDLAAKIAPLETEAVLERDLRRDAVRAYASPLVESREAAGRADTLHVGAHVIYRNDAPSADPRRLVLFGDSYAHFDANMLTIMLAETFREVHFIWSTSIDWGYVRAVRPDLVVGELAERFMAVVPDDRFDLDAYVAARYGPEAVGPVTARA